jgi:hypothetical protein
LQKKRTRIGAESLVPSFYARGAKFFFDKTDDPLEYESFGLKHAPPPFRACIRENMRLSCACATGNIRLRLDVENHESRQNDAPN